MASTQTTTPALPVNCPTCGKTFEGKFCYKCGEKQVDLKDYSIKKYLEQTVDMFTHFDGKFFVSVKYLLLYPGKLTAEYWDGRRVKLMKPLQLYIVVNLVFFFFLKDFDVFYTNLYYIQTQKGYFSEQAITMAKDKAAKKKISFEKYIEAFNKKAPENGKLYLLAFIPLMGLASYLLYFNKVPQYVPHLVFATHLFSFIVLSLFIYITVIVKPLVMYNWEFFDAHRGIIWGTLSVTVFAYIVKSNHVNFKEKWWLTLPKSVGIMASYMLIARMYKIGITFITIYTM